MLSLTQKQLSSNVRERDAMVKAREKGNHKIILELNLPKKKHLKIQEEEGLIY